MAASLADKEDGELMGMTALVIVDAQAGMFEEPEPVHAGDRLLKTLAGLLGRAREAGAPVVYIQHCGPAGSRLAKGSPGWSVHPRIAPVAGDIVVAKNEPDSFQGTDLDEQLRKRGVTRLVVGGIATEYCVDTMVRAAFGRGYRVVLVADGHSTWDGEVLTAEQAVAHHNHVLLRFGGVMPAADVQFT